MYVEHYGETLSGFKNPDIFIYNLETNEIENIGATVPAQICFKPNSKEIVFVSYTDFLYKLGLNFMMNRANSLRLFNIETKELTSIEHHDSLGGCLFPKFSPDGAHLVYFGVPKGSLAHAFCMPLVIMDWESKSSRILVDVVENFDPSFNGIYGFHNG